MGFKTASRQFLQTKSARSSDYSTFLNASTGNASITGTSLNANSVITTVTITPGANSSSSTSAISGGGGGASIAISSIQYLDANNAVISGDIAVSTTGGNILINGSGFASGSTVYVNNTLVSNTFISSSQIRAILPSASAGNVSLMIFTPSNVGAISTNGIRYSGVPSWTTAAVSFQNGTAANVALVASSDSTLTYTLQAGSTLPTGISLVSSGYLAGTATGYSGTSSSTVVIVATDVEGQATQQTITWTVASNDPQFPYTTLLLNGETAVTPFIKDSSTNSFPLTIAGDTRADKFTPYRGDGYYSNYFNGTSAYLSAPTNVAYQFGSGDFTIEFWAYPTSMAGYAVFGGVWTGTNSTSSWLVTVGATDTTALRFGYSDGTTATFVESTTGAVKLNTWTHLVVVRASGVLKMFSNGIQVYSSAVATTFASPASALVLGAAGAANYGQFYASNFRVVKGTAVYTSAFTPSTTPLTAISGTSALFCQSNRFIDTSSINATLTLTGGPTISPNIPFAASSNYATYGSAYFDGTGDYLSVPDSASLELGSSNFTIEFWINLSSSSGQSVILAHRTSDITNGPLAIFRTTGTTNLVLYLATGSSGWDIFSGNAIATVPVGQWSHVSICRSGSTFYSSINGVVSTLGTSASVVGDGTSAWSIGGDLNNNYTNGYISDLRIIKGTALYTTTFTPPTTPLTAVANTQLLALQYNGGANNYGIVDNGPFNNPITRVGNATQGTFSPYSPTGWSISYPALAYMTYATNPIGTFGAGATFTVEAWVNMSTYSATNYFFTLLASCDQATATYWAIGIGSTGLATVYWYDGATKSCAGSTVLAKGTWYHVAINVTAGVVKIYVNGVAETLTGTTTLTNPTGNSSYTTGCERGSSNGGSSGYISNLRTNTGALYPSAFTPSTTPLTNVANSTLLTAQSNRFVDNSSSARAITPFATTPPSVQAVSPFSPSASYSTSLHGGSAYFDGTGDYLTGQSITFGTNNFTLEFWWYPTSLPTNSMLVSAAVSSGTGGPQVQTSSTSINLGTYGVGNSISTSGGLVLNQWNHIVIVRSGTGTNQSSIFINGVRAANGTVSTNYVAGTIVIGGLYAGSGQMTFGYIADVRVNNGTAVYDPTLTTLTVPATPLTSSPSTPASLLLNMTNGGIVDAHSSNVFETASGAQLSTATKKYGSASMYFPNTASNCLQFPASNQSIAFGTGDFTVECWVNFTSSNGTYNPFVRYDGTGTFDFGYDFSTTQLKYSGSASIFAVTQTFTPGTWYHVALTRTSGSSRLFVNGTQVGTTVTGDTNNYATGAFKVGGSSFNAGHIMNGYIDDLRITKGFARYTANFTAPASQFLGQ